MGARIAIIIALTTFFSYLHIFNALRTETLVQLERGVLERVQREQAIFVLAQDNHALLKQVFEERVRFWRQEDPRAPFNRLFVQLPDGSTRSRLEGFDGTRMPCLFLPQGLNVDAQLQRSLLAAYDVLSQYGPAFHVRFTDTYISFPGGAIVLYWPAQPTGAMTPRPRSTSTSSISTPSALPRRIRSARPSGPASSRTPSPTRGPSPPPRPSIWTASTPRPSPTTSSSSSCSSAPSTSTCRAPTTCSCGTTESCSPTPR
ncbi:hypothetical protein ACN28S_31925 [Cystobacter fuscus]